MLRRASHLLAVVLLVALSAAAAAQEKDKDKKKPEAVTAVGADELMRQAEAKMAAGDAAGAAELARKATAMVGAPPSASLRLGQMLESGRDLDGAMDAYRAAGDKLTAAAKAEALGRLSVLQEVRGIAGSAESAEAASAADAQAPWALIALSRARARQGKADEALALAQKAVGAGNNPAAQAALGLAHESQRAWAEAEAAYRAAGAVDVADAAAAAGLARVLRRTGRAAEAAPLLEKTLAAYPGAVDAYKESARVKIALGRAADAFGDASTAAALAEGDPDAQRVVQEATVAKALVFLAQNQADMAIQDLTALRERSGDSALLHLGMGRALAAKRQADAALVELGKAAELEPSLAEAHFHAGYVQQVLKRNAAAAVVAYDKALAADAGNVEYRVSLGSALVDAQQFDRAVAELHKVTSDASYKRPEAWIYLGGAQLAAKRYKDAVAALDKAAAILPDNAQVQGYLAWSYFGLKDAAKFKVHGAKARTLGSKDATLLQYLTRIEAGEPIK